MRTVMVKLAVHEVLLPARAGERSAETVGTEEGEPRALGDAEEQLKTRHSTTNSNLHSFSVADTAAWSRTQDEADCWEFPVSKCHLCAAGRWLACSTPMNSEKVGTRST